MSTWTGWVDDVLARATLPATSENSAFLTQWAKQDGTSCGNNPLAMYWPESGASKCQPLGIRNEWIRKYVSHAQGAAAFDDQLRLDPYPNLLKALQGGDPWSVSDADAQKVTGELVYWGANKFSNYYGNATWAKQTGAISAPAAHAGWKALQDSFNRKMRPTLAHSQATTDAALRQLGKARKVRI